MAKNKNVSVVIPSYKGVNLFEKNLPSVLAVMRNNDQLIIVDDASGPEDDTLDWCQKRFKVKAIKNTSDLDVDLYLGEHKKGGKKLEVLLAINHQNQRFGENSNRGFKLSKHNLVFLINNDVAPHKGAIDKLLPHFEDPDVFAVGCMEIEKNLGGINSGKNVLWFERGMFLHRKADNFDFGETAWASGGSALIDRDKFLEIGGFDRLFYPAYWEDIDLSFQARKRGWKILFEPQAVVDHNHESTNTSVFGQQKMQQMSWRNAKKFTLKNGDFWQKLAYFLWQPYWMIKMNAKK